MKNNKVLVIYDYERIVPPFMQSLIKYAVQYFDEIQYITPPLPDYYIHSIDVPKVKIVSWSSVQRVKQYMKGILSIFRLNFWKELCNGKLSIGAFLNIGKYYFCSDGFLSLSGPYIKNKLKEGADVYVLGTWMAVDAFTSAKIKHKYPEIKAYALAHSGEVMAERNPFINQSFHKFDFENLDKVYFISSKVKDGYEKIVSNSNYIDLVRSKSTVRYLGSRKLTDTMNPENTKDELTILSCSRIDKNKRLANIVSALSKWEGRTINWIHIGTGVLEADVRQKASDLMKSNDKVKVCFMGRLDNLDVIKYYSENPIDLFINVSKSEGLPISIMEAMSYGIPCVATDVGGTSEIVNNNNGYLLSEYFRDQDLINILKSFDSLHKEEKTTLRKNAFNTWNDKFDASTNASNLFKEWLNIK